MVIFQGSCCSLCHISSNNQKDVQVFFGQLSTAWWRVSRVSQLSKTARILLALRPRWLSVSFRPQTFRIDGNLWWCRLVSMNLPWFIVIGRAFLIFVLVSIHNSMCIWCPVDILLVRHWYSIFVFVPAPTAPTYIHDTSWYDINISTYQHIINTNCCEILSCCIRCTCHAGSSLALPLDAAASCRGSRWC